VKKNKVAPPFKTAEFDIIYNEGISRSGDVLDMGVEVGVVEKKGAYYTFGETRLGQGRENAKAFLRENPELMDEIGQKIRQNVAALPARAFGSLEIEDGDKEVAYEEEE
jgi:recombination protein RecA